MKTRRVLGALTAVILLAAVWACEKTTYYDRAARQYYDKPVQQSRDIMPSQQKAEQPPAQPTPAPAPKAEAPKAEAPKPETPKTEAPAAK